MRAQPTPFPNASKRSRPTCRTDVLHVPFTYFPDAIGGTEVYVEGLVAALRAKGVEGAVAAPGEVEAAYSHAGVPVFRFAGSPAPTFAHAYGASDEDAARSFRRVLARTRPRVVHLHARTAAVSEALVDAAREVGALVVFTYHTPTVSCARGTMMLLGRMPCDGKLDVRRCAGCVLQRHGVPPVVRDAVAAMPRVVGEGLERAGLAGGPFTALRMPSLVGAEHRRFHALMGKVDHVIAVCSWVVDVLRVNGVPQTKLVLCRQGLSQRAIVSASPASSFERAEAVGGLRIGYFGRLDPTKGVDVLIEALRRVQDAHVRLDIYGVHQAGSEAYAGRLKRVAGADRRVAFHGALAPEAVIEAMRGCDFVAVPSRWLETGPLCWRSCESAEF